MSEQQIKVAGYVTSVIAMALIIFSFQCKKRGAFYAMQMSGNVVFAVSFLLLGNIAASLMNLMGLFRGLIMLLPDEKRKTWHLVLINALFVGGAAFAGTVGGEGAKCLVSFTAQTAGTFSMWYGTDKSIRWVQLCAISPLWIVNNTAISFSPGGLICEVFCMVSTIVYLIRVKACKKTAQASGTEGTA